MSDYISREAASADERKHKIKTQFARIVVGGTPEKPCYNIWYFDPTDGKCHIGFGSYRLDYVFRWLAEEFEITEPHTDVAPVKHWIPCSKRLPEIGVTVLTLDKYKHVASRTRKSYVNGTPYFYPDGLEPGRHITHWMPLPEMPEKEGT